MTCRECRDLMLEVARHRAAPFVDRSVLAHTAVCPNCRSRLEQERSLTAALRMAAADARSLTASPAVEARLMSAFAAQQRERTATEPAGPQSRVALGSVAKVWLPLAAAVVLIVGAAAWGTEWPVGVVPPTPQVARAEPPLLPHAAAPLPDRAAATPSTTAVSPAARAGGGRSARRPTRAAVPPVQAAGFELIPSAVGLPDFESGEIVRLGIPVTALPNYGVEIPAGAQSAVEADLLIGQDGQARAIRLVSTSAEAARPRQ